MTKRRKLQGFTLIEIMLVVIIIGVMSAIAIPAIVGKVKQARITTTKSSIQAIRQALTRYEMDTDGFPSTDQGLDALMEKPSVSPPRNWNGPYLQDYPVDAWSEDFTYKCPGEDGRMYDITSGGPTESEEDDINSWEINKRKNSD